MITINLVGIKSIDYTDEKVVLMPASMENMSKHFKGTCVKCTWELIRPGIRV